MRRPLASARLAAGLWLAGALIGLAGGLLGLAGGLGLAASANAAPLVSVRASLHPKIPGQSTTIRMTIRIAANGTLVPPPLLAAQVRYPAGLDVQLSGLGIQACPLATLEALGPQGCPPDSLMGYGRAVAEVPIKDEAVRETARIAIVRAAEQDGHLSLMLIVYEEPALSAQIVLPGALLPADEPYGGLLAIQVPLVPTFPEGPDISVTEIKLVLGPKHLRYSERVHGRVVHYEPGGIKLPGKCGHGGFQFAAQLSFLDGSQAGATTHVACPTRPRAAR